MNRLEMIILAILNKKNATSPISAISLYEIQEYASLPQSVATIYRTMQKLYLAQNIRRGLKDSKADTYYATKSGLALLKEMV